MKFPNLTSSLPFCCVCAILKSIKYSRSCLVKSATIFDPPETLDRLEAQQQFPQNQVRLTIRDAISEGKSCTMSGSIKFYYDLMSQPSRALYILFKIAKVPVEDQPIALRNGVHLQPEFKEVNRFQKVPCIMDNEFKLSESVAIVRYLQAKGVLSENWYPKENRARARTDEYLEWQHNNTRMGCAMYFQLKVLRPMLTGKESSPEQIKFATSVMENALNSIENIWLADSKFLTGNNMNVADIFGACEIEQTKIAGYDAGQGRPKLRAWMQAVKDSTDPYYSEAHTFVDKFAERAGSKL